LFIFITIYVIESFIVLSLSLKSPWLVYAPPFSEICHQSQTVNGCMKADHQALA
jgi:hypothetical protein